MISKKQINQKLVRKKTTLLFSTRYDQEKYIINSFDDIFHSTAWHLGDSVVDEANM